MDELSFLAKWGLVVVGVLASVAIPLLVAAIKKAMPDSGIGISAGVSFWKIALPYLLIGALSLVVGLLLALVIPMETAATAVLTGFAWDKTLQTIRDAGTNPAK